MRRAALRRARVPVGRRVLRPPAAGVTQHSLARVLLSAAQNFALELPPVCLLYFPLAYYDNLMQAVKTRNAGNMNNGH